MYLYVLRHGKAGEGYPDEVRELTDRGRQDLDTVLRRCKEKIQPLDAIQASPLVRAQQTADIAKKILSPDMTIDINDNLVPWASPQEFLNSLDDKLESVLVASHQPFVSELVQYLTSVEVHMGTSTIAAVDIEFPAQSGGEVVWVESPK